MGASDASEQNRFLQPLGIGRPFFHFEDACSGGTEDCLSSMYTFYLLHNLCGTPKREEGHKSNQGQFHLDRAANLNGHCQRSGQSTHVAQGYIPKPYQTQTPYRHVLCIPRVGISMTLFRAWGMHVRLGGERGCIRDRRCVW